MEQQRAYMYNGWTPTVYVKPASKDQLLALRDLCLQNDTAEYRSAAQAIENAIELISIAAHADDAHDARERERDIESLR